MRRLLTILIAVLILSNCATPIKGVFNPNDIPENDLITLNIHKNIRLHRVNNKKMDNPLYGTNEYAIKLPPGLNELEVKFVAYGASSNSTLTVSGIFEKNKSYILFPKPNFKTNIVTFHIFDYTNKIIEGDEVTFISEDMYVRNFIQYIATPISDNSKATISFKGSDFEIDFLPENKYQLRDIFTKNVTEGRCSFIFDLSQEIKIYLFETNIKEVSREDFLKSNYQEMSQTVLSVKYCSAASMKLTYEKPEELQGTEIYLYNIDWVFGF